MSILARLVKNKIILAIAGIIVIASLFIVNGRKPVLVKIAGIQPGELRVIVNATTTSTVKSETEVTLSAQRTGRIEKLPIREGDFVKKDALVAQLDLTEEEVQSESTLSQSRATFDEAEKNLKRMRDLFDKGMVSQQELDSARRTYEVAKSQYEAARDDIRVKKNYSMIRAPFDGVVSRKYTEVGEMILPGKQIVTIVNPARIYVLATIDEVDVGRLKIEQRVTISIDAFPGEKFSGTVRRISPIVSGGKLETRTADVWIYFDKQQPKIKPGMSADVEILINTLKSVLSVPSQSVIEREGKKQVFVALGSNLKAGSQTTAKLRPVDIGENNWSFTQVTGGLQEGEFVITTPEATGLKDGVAVKIEE